MLFDISVSDAVTYLGVSFILAVVAFLASYVRLAGPPKSIRSSPGGRSENERRRTVVASR